MWIGWSQLKPPLRIQTSRVPNLGADEIRPKSALSADPPRLNLLPPVLSAAIPQLPPPVYDVTGSLLFWLARSSKVNRRWRVTGMADKSGLGMSVIGVFGQMLWSGSAGLRTTWKRRQAPTAGSLDEPDGAPETVSIWPGPLPSRCSCRFTRSTVCPMV